MSLAAFKTSTQITSGLAAASYQVHSVTVTLSMEYSTNGPVVYDDTPDSRAQLRLDVINGTYDSARPIELYGVGSERVVRWIRFWQCVARSHAHE